MTVCAVDSIALVRSNAVMARGKNISSNLELRVRGWKAACRSDKVPAWLKPGLRKAIRRAEQRLRRRKANSTG